MTKPISPRTLSKSRFKSALECPTKLYYYGKKKEYANQMAENEFMMALAEGGFQVGELAKYSHPCCTEIGHCGHNINALKYHESLEETAKYIPKMLYFMNLLWPLRAN